MTAPSLHGRILVAATLVLGAFLGLTGIALDEAFRRSSDNAMHGRLQGQIYALLAAADDAPDGGMQLPDGLPEPRFNRPESGLYAQARGIGDDYLWQAASLVGERIELTPQLEPGARLYHTLDSPLGRLDVLAFGVTWEALDGAEHRYVLAVAEAAAARIEEQAAFRRTLWYWLGGMALVLLLTQAAVLRWGLRPLRTVEAGVRAIEAGEADRLEGRFPRELDGLARNINGLILQAEARQARFRNSLGDLAHSLKTPLAVLQGAAEADDPTPDGLRRMLAEQVARMNEIVRYQLQRAVTSGSASGARALEVAPVARRVVQSLEKVFASDKVVITVAIAPGARFRGEEGDLMELLGNLLENACKYGLGEVRIDGRDDDGMLRLAVEDNGPGIPPELRERVLKRGQRGDQSRPGHGIGLSIVAQIVDAYGGTLAIDDSPLGGARFALAFPNR